MLKRIFDFFIFSSLFIALVALIMVCETTHLLNLQHNRNLYFFVFFSTIASYNVHWRFTPAGSQEKIRSHWTGNHRTLNLVLIFVGLAGAGIFGLILMEHWIWLALGILLTFLYTAPKLPLPFSPFLKRIAVGKTIFLAAVWAYVTALLPLLISGQPIEMGNLTFFLYRFFMIYAICILFDYRDREQDRREGIRSMVTRFENRGVNRLFIITVLCCVICLLILGLQWSNWLIPISLAIPLIITASLFSYSRRNKSDYFYYFILDGLMMASALFTSFLSF